MSCMSYVLCLIYCIGIRLVLTSLVYVYLFQHYCTGVTTKNRLFDQVSVLYIKKLKKKLTKKLKKKKNSWNFLPAISQ